MHDMIDHCNEIRPLYPFCFSYLLLALEFRINFSGPFLAFIDVLKD